MRRAIIVTTSTVVGVAAVLGYKPNSQTAEALLDLTGANTTASTTSLDQPAAPAPVAPSTQPTSAAAAATTTPQPRATPTTKQQATSTAKQQAGTATPEPATTTAAPAPKPTAPAAATGTKTITGDAFNALSHGKDFGTVTTVVTISDGKITKITASQNPEGRNYPYIQAVRQYLIPAVLQAQKANVGYVSGATGTSEAFVQSLQSALDKA